MSVHIGVQVRGGARPPAPGEVPGDFADLVSKTRSAVRNRPMRLSVASEMRMPAGEGRAGIPESPPKMQAGVPVDTRPNEIVLVPDADGSLDPALRWLGDHRAYEAAVRAARAAHIDATRGTFHVDRVGEYVAESAGEAYEEDPSLPRDTRLEASRNKTSHNAFERMKKRRTPLVDRMSAALGSEGEVEDLAGALASHGGKRGGRVRPKDADLNLMRAIMQRRGLI